MCEWKGSAFTWYKANIRLSFFIPFLIGLPYNVVPVLSAVQKCYHCTDFVDGKTGHVSGQCSREWVEQPGDTVTCMDRADVPSKDLLLREPSTAIGCMTSYRLYHDKSRSVMASVQRSCEVRPATSREGCWRESSPDYIQVICRCSTGDYCNNMSWPTKEMGHLPFAEPESNKDVRDTYLAGKGRYCLVGTGRVDVRTGEEDGDGFLPDMDKLKGLCANQPIIKNTMANYPAKNRFVYCTTLYEMEGSRLNIRRACETQMVPAKDDCVVKSPTLKICYCNSDLCNNKVWEEESGMRALPLAAALPAAGRHFPLEKATDVDVKAKPPSASAMLATMLKSASTFSSRNGMLNACHRCDGEVYRTSGVIAGSCFLVDSIFTNPFSTQRLENCWKNDSEIAGALAEYPTAPLECVTTFTHFDDPRKAVEAKVERRCAVRTSFSQDGCTQPEKRTVNLQEELSVTCRCSASDGCNTHMWTAYSMPRTNLFKLPAGTVSGSVAEASKTRWRVCHVCWASRRTSSSAPYCYSAASLSASSQQSCMDLSHITAIVMNLPAEAHFIHCFTRFRQNGSTQSMERGCEVRLAPVQDSCDSEGYYCSCNSNGCNSQEWKDGGWQAAGQSSQMPLAAAATPMTPVPPRKNVSNAPPVPAGDTGGWNVSRLVRHCYWCKGTVERRTGVLTGCFGEGTALKEDIVECSEKDPTMRTDLFLNREHELECLTVFRYNTNLSSTHEATIERKCALRQSMASPVQQCSPAERKNEATGEYTEVVCRCSNGNYCNDDTWPTAQMGRPPFTVAAAVMPPLGSDLWGRGRSCHQCEGMVDVKSGKAHGCFFQDGLSNATAVRCAHASQYVQAILRNVPADQHFTHCVAQFDEGNSTERLVVRRYCDIRLAPVLDGCTAEGKVRTCRCNSHNCNNGLWSNQTGLVALPASAVVQTVGPLHVMEPVKATDISGLKPLKPVKLACYQCVSPPHEKDIINGHCFQPQHSPLVNCSDDPSFLSFFKEFPSFVPMCETEMKTTANKPHTYAIRRSCTAKTLEEAGEHHTTLRAADKIGYKVDRWRCLASYCNSHDPVSGLIDEEPTMTAEPITSGPNVTGPTPVGDESTRQPSSDPPSSPVTSDGPATSDPYVWINSTYGPYSFDQPSSWLPSGSSYASSTPSVAPLELSTSVQPLPPESSSPVIVVVARTKPFKAALSERPSQCSCSNPYCCPPPQAYPCGNPYGCKEWKCSNPSFCPPPGPNPWSCTNIVNCRPPGPNPWNCSSPWDCDVPEKNVWNCSCPWNCGPYQPWNCESPFDCRPPNDYQKCLNEPSKCTDVPPWLIKWWATHQAQTFPNLPPVRITLVQTVVQNSSQNVVTNGGNQPQGRPMQRSNQSQLDVERVDVDGGAGSTARSFALVLRQGDIGFSLMLFACLYVYF